MKKKHTLLLSLAVIALLGMIWLIWGNTTVELSECVVYEDNLPEAFDGYRIVHVSDLHNSWLWEQVIDKLQQTQPDVICITGDLIDRRKTNVDRALAFVAEAIKIAPCYYITGNHEELVSQTIYEELLEGLNALGVHVLLDEEVILEKDGAQIALVGYQWRKDPAVDQLSDFDGYRILLAHRPESFEDYVSSGYDLILSGHAHGGQVRLDYIGGIYAPGQGLFPKYDSGIYTSDAASMIVSRGIGNSSFPIRFNNRPEVIVVTLSIDTLDW